MDQLAEAGRQEKTGPWSVPRLFSMLMAHGYELTPSGMIEYAQYRREKERFFLKNGHATTS